MADLPKRTSHRLPQFDYNACGAYFLTICTYNRRRLFSRIVGALHEAPEIHLTKYGQIVDRVIGELPQRYPIEISNYIIMPDHIHMLLIIKGSERALREAPLQSRSLPAQIVGYLKMNVTKTIHRYMPSEKVWQRSFYDHIVRNEQDYQEIWQYIENNPQKWWLDKHTKNFRKREKIFQ